MNISSYSIELEILTGGINLSHFSVELFPVVKLVHMLSSGVKACQKISALSLLHIETAA